MKMSDRIKRNMQPHKPMTLISLRPPDHVIEDLKEVAQSLGFGGYRALIRHCGPTDLPAFDTVNRVCPATRRSPGRANDSFGARCSRSLRRLASVPRV